MEIYKLKDEVLEGKRGRYERTGVDVERGVVSGELRITDLRVGVKNPNRVNVFVNGKYTLSLDVAQVVDYEVKVGRVLSAKELDELKGASELGKLYQRTLEWVLLRPRSIRETKDYLRRKLRTSEDIAKFSDEVISRLVARGYLDDKKFAEWWVENRFVKKGVSMKRLRMELLQKGIGADVIDEALERVGRNDKDEIRKVIAKKRAKYPDDEKLIQYLCRQGFSYQLVSELVRCETD